MTERVLAVFQQARGLYGSPRVTRELGRQGVSVGRRRVARLMRRAQLQGRSARLYRRARVGQKTFYRAHPNLVHGVTTTGPDQLWVGDVTYVRVAGRWRYLAVVMDRHSRRVLGWSLGRNRDACLTRRALAHAVRWRRPSAGLTFHSDRGIEYSAFDVGEALSRLGFLQSMNRPRQMNDNAHMESFFHSLKTEWLFGTPLQTDSDLRAALFDYVRFYNRQRLHSSLGYVPPAVFEAQVPIHTVSTKPKQDPSLRSPLNAISFGVGGFMFGGQKRRTALLLIMVILEGCATLTPDAEKVRVTQNPEATKGCTFIKTISVVNTWGPGDSEKKLRVEAAKVGANLVFQGSDKYTVGGHSFVHYGDEAYRCEQ